MFPESRHQEQPVAADSGSSAGPPGAFAVDRPVPTDRLTLWAGLALLVASGFVDSYLYIAHGHVFAQAMTGNLVLIGIGALEPDIVAFWRPLIAVTAFGAGIAVGWLLGWKARDAPGRPQLVTLACEVAALAVVGLLPENFPQPAIVVAISFVSALQIASFTRLGGVSFMSTAMTGNILRTVDSVLIAVVARTRDARIVARTDVAGMAVFMIGVFAGAALTKWWGWRVSWVAAALFLLAGLLRFAEGTRAHRLRSQSNDSYGLAPQLVQ